MQIMLDETLNVWWAVMRRCQRQSYNFDFTRFVLFHFVLCQLEEEVYAGNDLCCDSVEWHLLAFYCSFNYFSKFNYFSPLNLDNYSKQYAVFPLYASILVTAGSRGHHVLVHPSVHLTIRPSS